MPCWGIVRERFQRDTLSGLFRPTATRKAGLPEVHNHMVGVLGLAWVLGAMPEFTPVVPEAGPPLGK